MTHYYSVFGLIFAMGHESPSLASVELYNVADRDVDVHVSLEAISIPGDTVEAIDLQVHIAEGTVYLDIEDAAVFSISGGNKIVFDPAPGAGEAEVSAYLLGTAMGVILYQRKRLPFHCNAVVVGGRTFLICGDSGAGKSTLAAWFRDRGHGLMTDDLCAIEIGDDGTVTATPGIPRMKLWKESLDLLDLSVDGLRQVPWTQDKYELSLDSIVRHNLPVAGIYHLTEAENGIHRLGTLAALNVLTANIYRRRVADLMGCSQNYLDATARIASGVPIHAFNRNWGLANFQLEAQLLEKHMINSNFIR